MLPIATIRLNQTAFLALLLNTVRMKEPFRGLYRDK